MKTNYFLRLFLFFWVAVFLSECFFAKSYAAGPQTEATAGENRTIIKDDNTAETVQENNKPSDLAGLTVTGAEPKEIFLGSPDANSGFKFQLELTSEGAAISRAILSEFDNRDYKNPTPLVILSAVKDFKGNEILPMANGWLEFVDQQLRLPLGKLEWEATDVIKGKDGAEQAIFHALIKNAGGKEVLKLTKAYQVNPGNYHLECSITLENLVETELNTSFELQGPAGIGKEGVRTDLRKVIGAFEVKDNRIETTSLDTRALKKAATLAARQLKHRNTGAKFIWAAITNKYFAAILRPVPDTGKPYCDWLSDKLAYSYPAEENSNDNETVGFKLNIESIKLGTTEKNRTRTFGFQLYLGPKDKDLFEKNELYRRLGFIQSIDFQACCGNIFRPLSFFILFLLKAMHKVIPNYGWVIIILVLVVRLILHPVTKSSQVSMMKMGKLGPKAEEIKKKYANNKAELNKQLMALYKDQGVSPMLGCLPMLLQMPIWIALYSAIYASIDLRGAAFLPFWITDLSAPDVIARFQPITIPFVNATIDSVSLLPILLGVAMYLQQKLTPQAMQAQASPQAAQQQKMMLVMMPVMMLIFLYKAPSGLNLYIMASTFGGVIEQYVIREHIREKEAREAEVMVDATAKTAGKSKKKKRRPFFRY